jgi:hypothetical protein
VIFRVFAVLDRCIALALGIVAVRAGRGPLPAERV